MYRFFFLENPFMEGFPSKKTRPERAWVEREVGAEAQWQIPESQTRPPPRRNAHTLQDS